MKRPSARTILISFGLFLFFFILLFPYRNLKGYIFSKIQEQTQILIFAEDLSPAFFGWPGFSMKKFNISIPMDGRELELQGDRLVMRVGIGGIFPPQLSKSLAIDRLKKGGDLYVKFSDTKNSVWIKYELDNVEFGQLLPTGFGDVVGGQLTGDGKLGIDWKTPTDSYGSGNLTFKSLKLAAQNLQGFLVPAIDMGDIKMKIAIKSGIVEFVQAQIGNDKTDIFGTVQGDLRLAANLMQSYLNLTLRFQVSEALRKNPKAASILAFLDGTYRSSKGDYAMKWIGTLEEISTRSPFPQKVGD